MCLDNDNDGDGVQQAFTVQVKETKRVVLKLGFKKDQTLRRSKLLGEAFVEGSSRFYTAAAVHVARGRLFQAYGGIKDGDVP